MATTRRTWFGVVVEFDNSEATQIANQVNAETPDPLSAARGIVRATLIGACLWLWAFAVFA